MTRQPGPAARADIVGLTFRLAGIVRRQFTAQMEGATWAQDANLRRGCFGVLSVLDRAGTALSQRDVAERVGIDPSDVVDLVDRLEAAGFVRRRRDDRDRRRYALELTGAGHDAIERFHAVARAVDDVVFDVLDPAERDQLRALLERVVAGTDDPG